MANLGLRLTNRGVCTGDSSLERICDLTRLTDRSERHYMTVTTNLRLSERTEAFGDETLTTALLDQRCHRPRIPETRGQRYGTRLGTTA